MSKEVKSKPVKEKAPGKSEEKCCCTGTECCNSTEDRFKKLLKSGMLADFVKNNNGSWDHLKWLMLCDDITTKGYAPIDFSQVGLALEQEKDNYFTKKK